jgi:DNA-binding NarL/FixJ family response regulator
MVPIRVLLVDDSPLFLGSVARVLATDRTLEIVGRVLSGQAALDYVNQSACDLVLLDLAMPQMNGLEVARHLRRLANPPRIVLLTLEDTAEHREAAASCTDGFVSKPQAATELLPMIRSLFAGGRAP